MTRWQARARLAIALLGVVVAIAVAMAIRRGERPVDGGVTVERADPSAVVESTRGVLTQTEGTSENFKVEFERQLTYEGGSSTLQGVRINIDQRGGRDFVLTSREGQVGTDQSSIILEGRVKLVASDGLTATAPEASYSDSEGIVRAPGRVEFARGRLSGNGLGMTYDRTIDEMTLLDQAFVRVEPDDSGAGRLVIRSAQAALNRSERYMLFQGGVVIARDSQNARADEATAYLAEDEDRVTAVELRGSARVITNDPPPGALRDMAANDINLVYTPDGQNLQQVTLAGTAFMQMAAAPGTRGTRIEGAVMEMSFAPDGQTVIALTARDRVRTQFPVGENVPARTVQSNLLESVGEPAEGLRKARFRDSVVYTEVLPGRPPVRRVVRAGTLEAEVKPGLGEIDDARFTEAVRFEENELSGSGAAARYRVAEGALHLTSPEGTPRPRVVDQQITVEADTIDLTLEGRKMKATTDVRSVLRGALGRPGTRARRGGAARLPGMLEQDQPVNVTAAELAYDEAEGRAVYTGSARLWQADTTIIGDSITLDDRTGDLTAVGAVRSMWVVEERDAETREVRKVPTIASAAELLYEDEQRRATYTTNAHVNGTQGDLTAIKIELYLKGAGKELDRAEAYDNVTVRLEKRTGTGGRMTYFADEERYLMSGSPVRIIEECRATTGKTLTFFKSTDRILVDGNEEIRTQTTSGGGCPEPPSE